MKKIVFISLILVASVNVFAKGSAELAKAEKSTAAIEGTVVDANTGESLVGVKVEVAGTVLFTDFDGKFKLDKANSEELTLACSLVSYKNYNQKVELNGKAKSLTIKLQEVE